MEKLEFKQIIELDSDNLNIITNWMYNWWGKDDGYTFEAVKCFIEHCFQKDRLPQTYGLFYDKRIIAMFQLAYEDLDVRTDIYPWLSNIYVDEAYRNKGVARILLQKVKETAKKQLDFSELYLYTEHIGLYEKFGWIYISDIDTHIKNPRIQRLYKLNLID